MITTFICLKSEPGDVEEVVTDLFDMEGPWMPVLNPLMVHLDEQENVLKSGSGGPFSSWILIGSLFSLRCGPLHWNSVQFDQHGGVCYC